MLSNIHVVKRLAWAQENIDKNFDNVIFTDECSILTRPWSNPSNKFVQRTVKHAV